MIREDWRNLSKLKISLLATKISGDQDLRLAIYDNMQKYAGSFVKALSEALMRADPVNVYRLCRAFPEYIIEYLPEKWERK